MSRVSYVCLLAASSACCALMMHALSMVMPIEVAVRDAPTPPIEVEDCPIFRGEDSAESNGARHLPCIRAFILWQRAI